MATVASVIRDVRNRQPRNGRYYAVAIDGRGCSGKSTLAAAVSTSTGWPVIAGDDYFEPLGSGICTCTPSGAAVWGGFNEVLFQHDVLERVAQGEFPTLRAYSYARQRYDAPEIFRIEEGVVIERCFTFSMPVAWDARIWVETPRDLCLERALRREELPPEQVRAVWEEVWQKDEDSYIGNVRPQELADCIVNGETRFLSQLLNPEE